MRQLVLPSTAFPLPQCREAPPALPALREVFQRLFVRLRFQRQDQAVLQQQPVVAHPAQLEHLAVLHGQVVGVLEVFSCLYPHR